MAETLLGRLRTQAQGAPVALGVDFPIGLPIAYVREHLQNYADFPTFLRQLSAEDEFFSVAATLAEVSATRPFYPIRGEAGMTMRGHATALRLPHAADLSRRCDRATAERPAGAPLFWTLGANQVGKAALHAWRQMLIPALQSTQPPLIWPFDGPFRALLRACPTMTASSRCVEQALSHCFERQLCRRADALICRRCLRAGDLAIAETYPAEALRHLRLKLRGSKRRQADRQHLAADLLASITSLEAVAEPELRHAIHDGFGANGDGEDRFDCVLGVLCVLNVLAGRRSDAAPEQTTIRQWEGWVLGQLDNDGVNS